MVITASEIQRMMHIRHENKKKSYHRIIELCSQRIYRAAQCNRAFCVYEVPDFLMGYPIYQLGECVEYVYAFLQNKGFRVEYIFPRVLIVRWEASPPTHAPAPAPPPAHWAGPPPRPSQNIALTGWQDAAPPQSHEGRSIARVLKPPTAPSQFVRSISEFKPSGKFVLNLQ